MDANFPPMLIFFGWVCRWLLLGGLLLAWKRRLLSWPFRSVDGVRTAQIVDQLCIEFEREVTQMSKDDGSMVAFCVV